MRYIRMIRFAACALFALSLAACGGGDGHGHDHEAEGHDHEAEEHVHESGDHDHEADEHGHGGSDEITIAPERAEQLGIVAVPVAETDIMESVEVGGEVIADPAGQGVVVASSPGSVSLVASLSVGSSVSKGQIIARIDGSGLVGGDAAAAAKLALDVAKAELDRLKPLREAGIVTVGEYNAALQAYNSAKLAYSSRGNSATAPISGIITSIDVANGQYVDAGQPIATVAAGSGVVVRADLPKRYASKMADFKTAVVLTPSGELVTVERKPGAVANAAGGYIPLYFNGTAPGLIGGLAVKVWLQGDGGRKGLAVPVEAVTERLGSKFVYVKLDDDCYERRPVKLGASDGLNVEIVEGLHPGEEVVTQGVTFVRLAETSNVAPEGHHHHH